MRPVNLMLNHHFIILETYLSLLSITICQIFILSLKKDM